MTYDVEWRRGDTKALVMTITSDGSPMNLSDYTKITMCVTSTKEPTDASAEVWKEDATILNQTNFPGKISVDMTDNSDETVDVPLFFDIQGINSSGKTDTLVGDGLMVYRQDKNKDLI